MGARQWAALVCFAALITMWLWAFAGISLFVFRRRMERKKKMADNKNKEKLAKVFKEGLQAQHRAGMIQGAKAICSVVLNIAQDTSITPDTRIEKIVAFCSISLNAKEKEAEQGGDQQ